jgi:hypothetical protein
MFRKAPYLLVTFLACLGLTVVFAVWVYAGSGMTQLDVLLKDNRGPIYGALSAVFGSLLGFTIAAVSVAMVLAQDDRMTIVRESGHYGTLWDVFTKSIFALAAATVTALVALVVDRDGNQKHFLVVGTFFFSLLSIARVFACVWLLEKLVKVIRNNPLSPKPAGPKCCKCCEGPAAA